MCVPAWDDGGKDIRVSPLVELAFTGCVYYIIYYVVIFFSEQVW